MEPETTTWIMTIASLAVFALVLLWLVRVLTRARLMRCPETGSVTFVRIAPAPQGEAKGAGVAVTQCDMWPDRKDCAQGCLARYPEVSPGSRVDLHSLRPF